MPIYEYECNACGHMLEAIQKISDEPLLKCPACEKNQLKKLVSAAAFQLKGSGWYVTDFKDRKKPQDKADTKKSPEDTGTGKKQSVPGDSSKSAKEADSKPKKVASETD